MEYRDVWQLQVRMLLVKWRYGSKLQ